MILTSVSTRKERLAELRALPFREAFRLTTRAHRGSWNSVTTGLAAMATLWLIHGFLVLRADNLPSLLGVALLPWASPWSCGAGCTPGPWSCSSGSSSASSVPPGRCGS